MLVFHLKGVLVDLETAFLHGELKGNDIYMECPKGMVHMEDECLQLMKTIYGLVQSARQFFKKLKVKLLKLGFEEGIVDPCLMVRKNKLGIVMIAIYVDDCLMIGKQEAIDDAIAGLEKSGFKLKIENELTDYLSCNIIFNKSKTKAWVGQPHLLKNLREKFGERVKKLQMYRTPGTPGYGVLRPEKDDPMQVSKEEHTIYRSGVGMLLYLVKHTRPDIANITRELSKVMDKPTKAAMKELHRAIKFVLDTADYGLKIEPVKRNEKWNLEIYTDSDWGGDKNTRHSVSGYILYLCNVPILWKSKSQRVVTLSSAEAEYYSLSEAAKDIKFVYMLLDFVGVNVELPIIVRVDNIGAIFMSENISTSNRTKHVDCRIRFVNQFIEDGFLKVIFVKSEDNKSDPLTKNVSGDIYEKHKEDYVGKKCDIVDKD